MPKGIFEKCFVSMGNITFALNYIIKKNLQL